MPPKRKHSGKAPIKEEAIDWRTIDRPTTPFPGFELKVIKSGASRSSAPTDKKQKTSTSNENKNAPRGAEIVQSNPFPGTDLSETHHRVEPEAEWERMSRYRTFSLKNNKIEEEDKDKIMFEFEVGQVVLVNKDEHPTECLDIKQFWVARVLEVRAADVAHVFLRVCWLYWPEDLPQGRQSYHGDNELIASNDMAIIEVQTVADSVEVTQWIENTESDWPAQDQMFWRQTLDVQKPKSRQLSKLATFCVDAVPCNPHEPLIYCPKCKQWLHARCLEQEAVQEATVTYSTVAKLKGRSVKSKKNVKKSSSVVSFTAHLLLKDSGAVVLTVTDKRPGKNDQQWNVDVSCLWCKKVIEKAAEKLPSDEDDEDGEHDTENDSCPDSENDTIAATAPPKESAKAGPSKNAPAGRPANARQRGWPPKQKRTPTASSKAQVTPAPHPVSESALQSGIRSIKRMLWRS